MTKTAILEQELRNIGIPAHLKGHQYMLSAVQIAAEKQITSDNIATEIYAPIAECFETTPERVSRAIEHATMVCCYRNESGADVKIPTNEQWINLIAQKIHS